MRIIRKLVLVLLMIGVLEFAQEPVFADCQGDCFSTYSGCTLSSDMQYDACYNAADNAFLDCYADADRDYEDCYNMAYPNEAAMSHCLDVYGVHMAACSDDFSATVYGCEAEANAREAVCQDALTYCQAQC